MNTAVDSLLRQLDVHPVLVEVGGDRQQPEIWANIASHSVYVGIGPECSLQSTQFFRQLLVREAVTSNDKNGNVQFYCTKDPTYSSILRPNSAVVSEFFDLAGVAVDREIGVNGSSLGAILKRLSVTQIDWLKTNVNGVDGRIVQSVDNDVRQHLLAIDTCLDFVDLFVEQDQSLHLHWKLVEDGFWLSNATTCGGVRMNNESVSRVVELDTRISKQLLAHRHRKTPGWMFATYLRTIDSLRDGNYPERDYVVLWIFALLNGQFGFATELCFAYQEVFGADHMSKIMISESIRRIRKLRPPISVSQLASRLLPKVIRGPIRRVLFG